ncbi:UvrB/uvrC motif protein [Gemmata obscuriglobus]|nr:UvrB/UvrC motif-containing protein [Gemmata obscuriglobus]QEG32193.1 UvrB/uvrC motif protein [Gemmata obscuriglobus]VTS11546.1 protein : UvrB/UvrC protein OS=Planctomyces limnophilus (strain ATCC 43296 / DSM 3776 / IFAM 1008 / 290) GN=Plim_0762 PE=4 SV=1: UVR [Gemmata obscuriglobus UQM 2246]
MKCMRCAKQATYHITEVLPEERFEEVHLCEDCAKKYLSQPHKKPAPAKPVDVREPGEEVLAGPTCGKCGLSYLEFRNHGRFGCAHDYDAFKGELLPLLESIHGEVRHVGKTPRRLPRTQSDQVELTALRRRLQQLVTEENYEEAARVRDRIRELENG